MDSKFMQAAVARHFDWMRQTLIPNTYYGGGEMDMLLISRARFVTEVEIKVTLQDWQQDWKKDKWKSPERDKVARLFYAIPYYLVGKTPAWMPDSAGILVVSAKGYISVQKNAKKTSTYRITDKEVMDLLHRVYCRYWKIRNRINGFDETDTALQNTYNNVLNQAHQGPENDDTGTSDRHGDEADTAEPPNDAHHSDLDEGGSQEH